MSELKHVTDAEFKAEVLDSSLPVLVDFWAPWCGPCRMVAPIVEALAAKYEGRLKVVKLNTDENQETPGKYDINGIPTLILFRAGREEKRMVGFRPQAAMEAELDGALK